jgi:hypothetical protein
MKKLYLNPQLTQNADLLTRGQLKNVLGGGPLVESTEPQNCIPKGYACNPVTEDTNCCPGSACTLNNDGSICAAAN